MKHLKKYNENYKEKDINEQIDEILDNLSIKKILSESEKEFMKEASNGTVKKVTIPNSSDLHNPHNIGTLWIGKDGVWKQLLSTDEENDMNSHHQKINDSNKRFEDAKKKNQEYFLKKLPELKNILLEYAEIQIENNKKEIEFLNKLKNISKKLDSDDKYKLNQKIDYAFGSLDSMSNQFGYILPELKFDDDGNYYIEK